MWNGTISNNGQLTHIYIQKPNGILEIVCEPDKDTKIDVYPYTYIGILFKSDFGLGTSGVDFVADDPNIPSINIPPIISPLAGALSRTSLYYVNENNFSITVN